VALSDSGLEKLGWVCSPLHPIPISALDMGKEHEGREKGDYPLFPHSTASAFQLQHMFTRLCAQLWAGLFSEGRWSGPALGSVKLLLQE
jgi:hypothetical protein